MKLKPFRIDATRSRPAGLAAATTAVILAASGTASAVPVPGETPVDYSGYALVDGRWRTAADSGVLRVNARDAPSLHAAFTVRLVDPTGAAAAPTTLALVAGRTQPHGASTLLPEPQPARQPSTGTLTWHVDAAAGSQDLLIAMPRYSPIGAPFAPTDDPAAAAAAVTARLRVRATSTINVARVVSSPRKRFTVRGRLDGRAGDPTRARVQVQAALRGRWRTVARTAPNEAGRWSAPARLRTARPGRVRLRAVVVPAAGYPYETGRSIERPIRIARSR